MLAGAGVWVLCQGQAGVEGSLGLENQLTGFGPRAWADLCSPSPLSCPSCSSPCPLTSPTTTTSYFLTLSPCFAPLPCALGMFRSGEAASVCFLFPTHSALSLTL